MTIEAIRVKGIEKSFKNVHVLRGVDFDVSAGSIFALLGSNGAGKTTLVRILSTLLKPDAGTAIVNGFDVATNPADVRESISLTGQFAAVDDILTGRENLVLVARLRHLANPGAIADQLLARFSLGDAGKRPASTYSAHGAPSFGHGRIRGEATIPRGGLPRPHRRNRYRRHHRRRRHRRHRPRTKGRTMTTHVLGDTGVLTGRSLRHILRSPDTIITTAVTPVALMLLFVYVLGGAIDTGSTEPYVNYMLPGILLITIASGVAYTAYRLFLDMQGGIVDRFQSMPIARSSVLWAHVLTSVVANLVSVAVVIGVALIMGFRTGASVGSWLAATGILVLFTLALTWLAVMAGLSAKTIDGASAYSYPLIFLPFISSAFVPTASMPGPVAWFADNQPVTSIVNTIRALFGDGSVGTEIWITLAWLVGILVVAYGFAIATYRRRVS